MVVRSGLVLFLATTCLELLQCDRSFAPSGLKISFVTRNAVSLAWTAEPHSAYYMIMMKPVDNTSEFLSYGPNAKFPIPQAEIGGLITGDKLALKLMFSRIYCNI